MSYLDGEPWGWCEYCGDGTEVGEDPRPDLCAMCAEAGRGRRAEDVEPIDPGKQWPPPLAHKRSILERIADRSLCSCSTAAHFPGTVTWCYFAVGLAPGRLVAGAWT